MTCHEARRLLSPYLDSELDPGQTFEIGIHLQECQACRERFAAEQEVERSVVERLKTEAMPAELWSTIRQRVLSTRRRTPWFYWGGITAALAACLLIAVIAGWPGGIATVVRVAMPGADPFRMATNSGRHATPAPGAEAWLVSEFRAQDAAPARVADAAAAQTLAQLAQESFHRQIRMNMASEATAGHQVDLLSVARDATSGGHTLLIRLRCCGQPVLVAISSAASPGPLAEIATAASGRPEFQSHVGDLNVAAWRSGDLVIGAVSRHPVAQLEKAFEVTMS